MKPRKPAKLVGRPRKPPPKRYDPPRLAVPTGCGGGRRVCRVEVREDR